MLVTPVPKIFPNIYQVFQHVFLNIFQNVLQLIKINLIPFFLYKKLQKTHVFVNTLNHYLQFLFKFSTLTPVNNVFQIVFQNVFYFVYILKTIIQIFQHHFLVYLVFLTILLYKQCHLLSSLYFHSFHYLLHFINTKLFTPQFKLFFHILIRAFTLLLTLNLTL